MSQFLSFKLAALLRYGQFSGVTRNMVIPGPGTEVIGESKSRGVGAQPPDAGKSLILHVLNNCLKL